MVSMSVDHTVWKHVLRVLVTDVLRGNGIKIIESSPFNKLALYLEWNGSENTFHSCDGCILVRLEERAFVHGLISVSPWSDDFGSFLTPNVREVGVKFRVELVLRRGMYMSSHNLLIDISDPGSFGDVHRLVGLHYD